jgi:hypothetical protein
VIIRNGAHPISVGYWNVRYLGEGDEPGHTWHYDATARHDQRTLGGIGHPVPSICLRVAAGRRPAMA